jgi:hypothetical protein
MTGLHSILIHPRRRCTPYSSIVQLGSTEPFSTRHRQFAWSNRANMPRDACLNWPRPSVQSCVTDCLFGVFVFWGGGWGAWLVFYKDQLQ